MKLNLRLKSLWRVALLLVVVAVLVWYVAKKRAEWEEITRPIGHLDNATAVLATLPPPTPAPAPSAEGEGFALARLERDRTRAASEEKLRDLAADAAMPEPSRLDAAAKLTAIVEREAEEAELEQQLRDKGYADALVTLNERAGRILVRGRSELSRQELAQVADLAKQIAGLKPWELTILVRP